MYAVQARNSDTDCFLCEKKTCGIPLARCSEDLIYRCFQDKSPSSLELHSTQPFLVIVEQIVVNSAHIHTRER